MMDPTFLRFSKKLYLAHFLHTEEGKSRQEVHDFIVDHDDTTYGLVAGASYPFVTSSGVTCNSPDDLQRAFITDVLDFYYNQSPEWQVDIQAAITEMEAVNLAMQADTKRYVLNGAPQDLFVSYPTPNAPCTHMTVSAVLADVNAKDTFLDVAAGHARNVEADWVHFSEEGWLTSPGWTGRPKDDPNQTEVVIDQTVTPLGFEVLTIRDIVRRKNGSIKKLNNKRSRVQPLSGKFGNIYFR